MSDNFLKKDGVQIEDIQKEIKEIFELYDTFYEAPKDTSSIQTGNEIKCKYMEEDLKDALRKIEQSGQTTHRKKRFTKLLKQIHRRVERRGFIGSLEKSITHKIAKAFRTNTVDAATAAAFLAMDVGAIIFDIIFSAASISAGSVLLGKETKTVAGYAIKLPIDAAVIIGTETLSLVSIDSKIEFVNEKAKGKKGQNEYAKEGKKFEQDISQRLGSLDEEEAKVLFKALGRVYKYYLPKINSHFNQCNNAYDAVFQRIFKGREPAKTDISELLQALDSKKKDPEFKTCDDMVRFTKDVYQLYHEIYKLRQYLMPMLRFMHAITIQAQIWQDDLWTGKNLWETEKLIEKLKTFDTAKHTTCEGTHFCYGPQKRYKRKTDQQGKEIKQPIPKAHKTTGDIEYPDKSTPHKKMKSTQRSPWKNPTQEKLIKRNDTWFTKWEEDKKKKKKDIEKYKEKLKDPEYKKQQKALKKSQREYVLNDKNDRISRFVHAAKKAVSTGDDEPEKRFQSLTTDIGIFTEYRGWFGGKWRWAKHYFFPPKSRTKTALNIALFVGGTAVGLAIFIGLEVATAGLATAGAAAIAAGVAAVWGVGKLAADKVIDLVEDKLEGSYDKHTLKTGKDWYGMGTLSDKKRMRLNRNADASAKVVSHMLSSLKNYKRLTFFREGNTLDNIKDCDNLAQYLWSVYKLQHHAYKVVEYNRPMLDFIATCSKNLERWEAVFNKHIDRSMKYAYKYIKPDDNHEERYKKHIESCGKTYKKEAFHAIRHLFRSKEEKNTFDINFRKSIFCYGPHWKKPSQHKFTFLYFYVLRPMNLRTDIKGKDKKRRYISKAVEKLKDIEVVIDD